MRKIRLRQRLRDQPSAGRNSGVTLIELLVVIAIAAILMLVAAPSFTTFMNSTRLSSTSSQLLNDLNVARSEAIKRNSRMLVCVRNTAGNDCATGTNWAPGWLVCYDSETSATPGNGIPDGQCDVVPSGSTNANPIVLRPALGSTLTLVGSSATIRFNANGSQGAPGATAATLVLGLNPSTGATRTVTVAATGNISKQ